MSDAIASGTLGDGAGWLRMGGGPPLVISTGLTPSHGVPRGVWRSMSVATMSAYASDFTVWTITRPVGLRPGATTGDLAMSLRRGIESLVGEPTALIGTSTGSSIALRAVLDDPALAHRLVVADGACRLTGHGRKVHAQMADELGRGEQYRAWRHSMMRTDGPIKGLLTATAGFVMPGYLRTENPRDAAVTMHADVDFDVTSQLHRIQIPTLVIGGSEDPLYGPEPMRETAAGIPNALLLRLDGQGHGVTRQAYARGLIRDFLTGLMHPVARANR